MEESISGGLKVNINKAKVFQNGAKTMRTLACYKYPCSVCKRNAVKCTKCENQDALKFEEALQKQQILFAKNAKVCWKEMARNDMETVDRFLTFKDVLSTEGGAQEAITSRKRSTWKKFKDVSNVLFKKGMSLRIKETLYKSYV